MSRASVSAPEADVRGLPALDARAAITRLSCQSTRIPLVVGFYALAAAVCTFPLVLHLADALAPAPDALLHTWILAWDIHALTTDPAHLYEANIYFPLPLSLTYSDSMLSGALMVAPILLLSGNAILAHNVLTLASLVIAGFGTYLLVRALSGNEIGALVAGCVFAFCASRQAHLEHVNLLQFGWLPLALLCLHKAVVRGRTSDFLLLALLTVCQALASVYLAWMMAVAYVVFIVVEVAYRRAAWRVGNIARLGGALLVAALVVVPVMWPYRQMQQLYGFQWPSDVIVGFSAVPTDYLTVPPQNLLYNKILGRFRPENFSTEHVLFPGFAALMLALVAVSRRTTNIEVVRYALMALVAFVLSFGPVLRLDGATQTITLPYAYLLEHLPAFGVMRVPARFDFLLMLALAVLAGFGVARLSATLSRWPRALPRRTALGAVVAVTLLELLPRPQMVTPVAVGSAVPPVYQWLRAQDSTTAVAEIPTKGPTGFASFEYEYMSIYHWHPLVNGSSGFEPPASKPVEEQLNAFPGPSAVAHLRSLGLRYLVAHLDSLDGAQTQRLNDADLSQLQLRVVATLGRDVVYEFAPLPNWPSLQDHINMELPTLVGRGQTPFVTVTITNATPQPLFLGAPESVSAQLQWDQGGVTEEGRRKVPLFVESDHTVSLAFPAKLSSSVTASDSAQLRVRLTGSVELEATQMVKIVDLPTSAQRSGLSANLERVQLPTVVRANSVIPIEVTARNTGRAVWLPDPAGTTGTKGVTGVSIRSWTGTDGKVWPPSESSTGHVEWNVNPGQAAAVTLQTRTPTVPGHYTLALDMLSEDVTWFDDVNGGARTLVPVDVEP